ncbi:MAG: DNA-binding response regulator [Lysobacteraceae bacterium]|nr:MAG: DNA-binding response regulator [Xanthomonadaceae bacterium]
MVRIGLLEDDEDQSRLIELWLEEAGIRCQSWSSGWQFVRAMPDQGFDMLILDWMVPDMSGIEVLRWVRRNLDWSLPIIFATARDQEGDIVEALSAGADDYMVKPIKQHELIARVSAVARRAGLGVEKDGEVSLDPYRVDLKTREVYKNDELLVLTKREFELAAYLFENHGRVLSRAQLLREVWGLNDTVNTRTVDTHMSRVRAKLGLTPEEGWRLSSVYHYGYRLEQLQS